MSDKDQLEPEAQLSRRTLLKSGLASLFVAGVPGFALTACGKSEDKAGAATAAKDGPQGELRVLLSTMQEQTFLPHNGSGSRQLYLSAMYDYPFMARIDEPGIAAGLITGCKLSPDGKTLRCTVRQGVKFHNGTPLTSADIKYTVEMLKRDDSAASSAALLRNELVSIETPSDSEIVFNFKHLFAELPEGVLSTYAYSAMVQSRDYVEKVGVQEAEKAPIGTGPYKLVSRSPDLITYEAVDDHWRATPQFKRLTFRNVPEPSVQLNLMRSGEADLVSVGFDNVAQFESDPKLHKIVQPGVYSAHMHFGGLYMPGDKRYTQDQPFNDIRVREAMNLAIDRNAICKEVYHGNAKPARLSAWDFLLPPDVPAYPYNPARAKELLAQAGYAKGFPIVMKSWARDPGKELPDIVQIVAQYWKQIGLDPQVVPQDYAAFRSTWTKGEAKGQVFPLTLPSYFPSPEDNLGKWYGLNSSIAVYQSPEIQKLFLELKAEADPVARKKIAVEVAKTLYSQYAEIPIAIADAVYFASKKVAEWKPPAKWYPMYHEYAKQEPPAKTTIRYEPTQPL